MEVSNKNEDELNSWLKGFENQIEPSVFSQISETPSANGFSSRLELKLIREEELNIMFNSQIPLGAKALLQYQLDLLREESPLVAKSRRADQPESSNENPKKKNVVRALQLQQRNLTDQVAMEKEDLREIDLNIESMDVEIKEPPAIGTGKTICGHCHHRGHKNQATKPCLLKKCTEYTYCGIKDKHPEYFAKLNSLRMQRRKKEGAITDLEGRLKSMQQFSSSSEFQFVKNLAPRLYAADPSYKLNKAKLMRDVRLLREGLDGKIQEITTNDPEQLRLLISKLRKHHGLGEQVESVTTEFDMNADTIEYAPPPVPRVKHADKQFDTDSDSCSTEEEYVKAKKQKKSKRKEKRHRKARCFHKSDFDFSHPPPFYPYTPAYTAPNPAFASSIFSFFPSAAYGGAGPTTCSPEVAGRSLAWANFGITNNVSSTQQLPLPIVVLIATYHNHQAARRPLALFLNLEIPNISCDCKGH